MIATSLPFALLVVAVSIAAGVLFVAIFGATCRMLSDATLRESRAWDRVDQELVERDRGRVDVRELDPDDFGFVEWQG